MLVKSAATVKALSLKLPAWFSEGSGREAQPKSAALDNIWTDPAGFASASTKFQSESAKLNQVAATGNIDATRLLFLATGKTCGGCHTAYREKKS